MSSLRAVTAVLVLSATSAWPGAAADSPACTAAKNEVTKTEAQIADLKKKLAALETALATRKAAAAKACPAVQIAPLVKSPVKSARLPLAAVASFFDEALQGTRLRFHTNGAQDSAIFPGPRLGGGRIPIAIQVPPMQAGPFSANAFLNEMNSNRLGVSFAGGRFVVTIGFESDGTEVIVRGAAVVLNVDADNGQVFLRLAPGLDASGRPSFSTLDADLMADLRCSSPSPFMGDACNVVIGSARGFLQEVARSEVKRTFDTPDLKSRVGAAVRALLDAPAGKAAIERATGQKIGTIVATRFEADALVIDHD